MEQTTPYTIHFIYEIREDAMKFQLQADVTVMADNTYVVDNIRHAGRVSGSLIPAINLIKHKGSWLYTDSKKETALSLAVGHAIDNHGKTPSAT